MLVGLGGASGSGKTAFSEKVKDFMPGIAVISMDNYNDGSKVVDSNFDDPRLTDYDLLLTNLADLRAGKPADVPIYDFKQSARVGYNSVPVPASRVVIIEGIYALSERLRPLLDLRVSIAGGVHFDLVKRVLRDINRSGQGPEEIIPVPYTQLTLPTNSDAYNFGVPRTLKQKTSKQTTTQQHLS